MAPSPLPYQATSARCLRYALKFSAIGAVSLGTIAFVHVSWDAYKFQASGLVPVDDPALMLLGITLFGTFVGGVLGAILGIGAGAIMGMDK